jgi:hypothetical protein
MELKIELFDDDYQTAIFQCFDEKWLRIPIRADQNSFTTPLNI